MDYFKSREKTALIEFGFAYTKVGITGNLMPFALVPTDIQFIQQYKEVRQPKITTLNDIIQSQAIPIAMQISEFLNKIIY